MPSEKSWKHYRAIELLRKEEDPKEIAARLGVRTSTVTTWGREAGMDIPRDRGWMDIREALNRIAPAAPALVTVFGKGRRQG